MSGFSKCAQHPSQGAKGLCVEQLWAPRAVVMELGHSWGREGRGRGGGGRGGWAEGRQGEQEGWGRKSSTASVCQCNACPQCCHFTLTGQLEWTSAWEQLATGHLLMFCYYTPF